MNRNEVFSCVDHTLLKAASTFEEVKILCEEALRYHAASVCIPPSFVKRVKQAFGERLTICTVVGFPLGYHTSDCKIFEARQAVLEGADEIDMVVNLGDVKEGNFQRITEEIRGVKSAIKGKLLKVIVETCYLSEAEKVALCKCVTEGGADFIKTSTGFGTQGAALEDVELMKKHIGENVKIKAAGGIRTREDMERFIEAGCARIGASSAVKALFSE
ncbi:deoxyribose-phosphate aldolase [Christensenellaceae bacterium OttesenSCG-928-M15]|nr:deoxyribose-phosphate aldolase [Christensenellaceae bacterium OttesenSCG-928-M15]